jgi:hypothetical protein
VPCGWRRLEPLNGRKENFDMQDARNVLGGRLEMCCRSPMTGFYRTGRCETGPDDLGVHSVCVEVTAEFLAYSKAVGNDLSTPQMGFGFPGLQPGDRWCLCAARWKQAFDAGMAPPLVLSATHEATLEIASLDELMEHAVDVS